MKINPPRGRISPNILSVVGAAPRPRAVLFPASFPKVWTTPPASDRVELTLSQQGAGRDLPHHRISEPTHPPKSIVITRGFKATRQTQLCFYRCVTWCFCRLFWFVDPPLFLDSCLRQFELLPADNNTSFVCVTRLPVRTHVSSVWLLVGALDMRTGHKVP